MSVRIPLEVSSTGVESVKKIREEITKAKKDIEDIEDKSTRGLTDEERESADKKRDEELDDEEKLGFKKEEKAEPTSKKKITDAFEQGDFTKLTELEAKVAEKVLEKLKDRGITNTSEVTKKDFNKILNETNKEQIEKTPKINKVLEKDLGVSKAGNLLGYAENPSGAILQQLIKGGALPVALIAAPAVADKIFEFLQQEGNILDRFFDDKISNRTNALRDKTTQQRILQGFDALRISTIDGNSDPRNLFNSLEVFENDEQLHNDLFKIRTTVN